MDKLFLNKPMQDRDVLPKTILSEIPANEIDIQWGIAIYFYPDLYEIHERLALLSRHLDAEYLNKLIETKDFSNRYALAVEFEKTFFEKIFGQNYSLSAYALKLLDLGATSITELLKCVAVVGSNIDADLIVAYIESTHPVIPRAWKPSYQSQLLSLSLTKEHSKQLTRFELLEKKSPLEKLKATFFGSLYQKHLRQNRQIRNASFWLWKTGYPLYLRHIQGLFNSNKSVRWIRLADLNLYVKNSNCSSHLLQSPEIVATPFPTTYFDAKTDYVISPHDQYCFPEISVSKIHKAKVYAETNLIQVKNLVVHHGLYNFSSDYTSEELHGRAIIRTKSNKVKWLQYDEAPEFLPAAAQFTDSCASNYAHWITEVLPRIVMFCGTPQYQNVPLIVDGNLHPNIMQSLSLIAGPSREIYLLPAGRAVLVEELFVTSPTGYVPFERRANHEVDHSHGQFSRTAFAKLQSEISKSTINNSAEKWPKKIYLRRNSGSRRVTNSVAIEKHLLKLGFVTIEPEKLGFLQQAELFHNADVIVGSSGAALANLVFCKPTVIIYILMSHAPNTSYWYWQNIACASGCTVRYILGIPMEGNHEGIHSDFSIDIGLLERALG